MTSAAAGDSIFECKGSGNPVVILEAGLRNRADIWSVKPNAGEAVFPQVADFTRICAYNRPGTTFADQFSRSDPAPIPRTADAVTDLHALLGAAAIPPPYVLDGHLLVDPPKELAGYEELETIDFDVSFDETRATSKAPLSPIPAFARYYRLAAGNAGRGLDHWPERARSATPEHAPPNRHQEQPLRADRRAAIGDRRD